MKIITYFLVLVIVLMGITFAVLNPSEVTVNYYIGKKVMPLSLLLALVFGVGCLFGLLVGFWLVFKAKIRNFRLKHQLKLAEKEVQNLRAIPLQDKH